MLSKLKQKLGDNVKENEPLAPYTTFKIGGPAKYFFEAKTSDELVKALDAARELKIEYFVLGGGSNILVSDQGIDKFVIKQSNDKFKITGEKVYAQSGASAIELLDATLKANLIGWPWAAGLPGTIGGAVRGNAGAYGAGMKDLTEEVEIYQNGKISKYSNADMKFSYRHSIIKDDPSIVILSVTMKLKKGSPEEVKKDIEQVKFYNDRRDSTQPLELPNPGCVFKNIDLTKVKVDKEKVKRVLDLTEEEWVKGTKFNKLPVAFLVDKLGLKGKIIGGAQISTKHCAFIVNVDNAKAEHVVMLMSDLKMHIRDKLGIQLQEEIQYVGF